MTQHAFQAQVAEVLGLVIHSLYSNKEIFLRELLSNASDALDKERFLALSSPSDSSDPLRIRISVDEAAGTLSIDDNGLGMDEAELVKNLGTIAHSGSKEFLSQLTEKKDLNIIGQFGVGFYSAYLVSDRVSVIAKKRGTDQAFSWESDGKDGFQVAPAERSGRGTKVTLHLKEDQKEFLKSWRLKELVARYSDYVSYPIELESEKDGEKTYEKVNQASALWQRRPTEVTKEQYEEFYKHLTHDWEAPLAQKHFHVEGTQEFTGLLFVPKRPPFDLFSPEKSHGVRLHVKRVFIMDDCKELLPNWLRFMRGVVDSEDLPLNVSRELLQDSKLVRIIKKQVTKQILDLLEEMAEKSPDDYLAFWKAYGTVFKEGLHFEPDLKSRLEKLVRFESSKVDGVTSLTDYVSRMPEGQSAIYYILGPSRKTVESSPHLEALRARGFEILYMTDAVDEWAVRELGEFEGKPVRSVMDETLDVEPEKEEDKKKDEEAKVGFEGLLGKMKEVLSDAIGEVRLTNRLTDSPSCLVVPDGGLAPYLERLIRVQEGNSGPRQKRILEVNPKHPLVVALRGLHDGGAEAETVREFTELLYDQALLSEGSPIEDPGRMAKSLTKLMQRAAEAKA